jgi:hypothetical protein
VLGVVELLFAKQLEMVQERLGNMVEGRDENEGLSRLWTKLHNQCFKFEQRSETRRIRVQIGGNGRSHANWFASDFFELIFFSSILLFPSHTKKGPIGALHRDSLDTMAEVAWEASLMTHGSGI